MNNPIGRTAGPGQVISLTRRSAWRREYDMRAAGTRPRLGTLAARAALFAQAEGRGIGLIDVATRRRRVVAAGPAARHRSRPYPASEAARSSTPSRATPFARTGPHEGITGPYVSILHHGHVMHRMPGSAWPAADIPPVTDPNIAADPARRAQPVIVTQCD